MILFCLKHKKLEKYKTITNVLYKEGVLVKKKYFILIVLFVVLFASITESGFAKRRGYNGGQADMTPSKRIVRAGDLLRITGTGFRPNHGVTISIRRRRQAKRFIVARATTNNNGDFTKVLRVPAYIYNRRPHKKKNNWIWSELRANDGEFYDFERIKITAPSQNSPWTESTSFKGKVIRKAKSIVKSIGMFISGLLS